MKALAAESRLNWRHWMWGRIGPSNCCDGGHRALAEEVCLAGAGPAQRRARGHGSDLDVLAEHVDVHWVGDRECDEQGQHPEDRRAPPPAPRVHPSGGRPIPGCDLGTDRSWVSW